MQIASTLLGYGAETDTVTKQGVTPLHLASQEGHSDMVTLLLEKGANIYASTKVLRFGPSLPTCLPAYQPTTSLATYQSPAYLPVYVPTYHAPVGVRGDAVCFLQCALCSPSLCRVDSQPYTLQPRKIK